MEHPDRWHSRAGRRDRRQHLGAKKGMRERACPEPAPGLPVRIRRMPAALSTLGRPQVVAPRLRSVAARCHRAPAASAVPGFVHEQPSAVIAGAALEPKGVAPVNKEPGSRRLDRGKQRRS